MAGSDLTAEQRSQVQDAVNCLDKEGKEFVFSSGCKIVLWPICSPACFKVLPAPKWSVDKLICK